MLTNDASTARPFFKGKFILTLLVIAATFVVFGGYFVTNSPSSLNLNTETQILKPFVDSRSYRYIVLPNKMKVILVSDPQTASSAAAVEVGVGSLSDPKEVPGLAHFCEHMVFLGSKKYPLHDDFDNFIGKSNGYTDAYTDLEATSYHFAVNNQAFNKALDMFAHFFIDPIFNKDYVIKEANAVNSEFEKYFQSSDWRIYYLLYILADESHPLSRFKTGNFDTLITEPKAKNIDVVQVLRDFYRMYYSANIMTLTLVSNQTLDELEKLAKETFSQVVNKDIAAPNFKSAGLPFAKNRGKYILFKPVRNENVLKIVFQFPALADQKNVLPMDYIYKIVNRKGDGSLFKYVTNRGLVKDVTFSVLSEASFGTIAALGFELTEEGIENLDEILRIYSVYLDKIRKDGVRLELYNQYQRLQEITFNYTIKETDTAAIAKTISKCLRKTSPSEVLTCKNNFKEFNKEMITTLLESMRLESTMVLISSPKFKSRNKSIISNSQLEFIESSDSKQLNIARLLTEKKTASNAIKPLPLNQYNALYKVEYVLAPIPKDFFKTLKLTDPAKFPELFSPTINKFVPTQLALACSKPSQQECIAEFRRDAEKTAPVQISTNTSQGNIWYQLDRSFLAPKFAATFIFKNPEVLKNVQKLVSMQLYRIVAQKSLLMTADDMIEAGFDVDLDCEGDSLVVKISGLSYKVNEVIETIGKAIKGVELSQEAFNRAKEELLGFLEQEKKQDLNDKVIERLKEVLLQYYYTPDERTSALNELNHADWLKYVDSFGSNTTAESVLIGDISQDTAKLAVSHLIQSLRIKTAPKNETFNNSPGNLTNKSYVLRSPNRLEENRDNCVLNYYQETNISEDNHVRALFLEGMLRVRAFIYLRTEKQLGYVATSLSEVYRNVYGISVLVQGANKTSLEIDKEIEIFLEIVEKYLSDLSEAEYEAYKKGYIERLAEKDKSLVYKLSRYAAAVKDMTYRFDRKSDRIARIASVSKSDILKYFKRITKENANRISIQVQYNQSYEISPVVLSSNETYSKKAETLINDASELKKLPRLSL